MAVQSSRVRLTGRGRLVVLGLFLVLAAAGVALLAPASGAAGPSGDRSGGREVAVVRPGDTLWSLTERHRPGGDPFDTIEQIRRINRLPDYTVHAGQRLRLPRAQR